MKHLSTQRKRKQASVKLENSLSSGERKGNSLDLSVSCAKTLIFLWFWRRLSAEVIRVSLFASSEERVNKINYRQKVLERPAKESESLVAEKINSLLIYFLSSAEPVILREVGSTIKSSAFGRLTSKAKYFL